jgi:hypothetical protein
MKWPSITGTMIAQETAISYVSFHDSDTISISLATPSSSPWHSHEFLFKKYSPPPPFLLFFSHGLLDGEWRAAEGIGLTYGYSRQWTDNLGSGRVESYSAYLFRPAKVEVYGTPARGKQPIDSNSNLHSVISSYGHFIHKLKN